MLDFPVKGEGSLGLGGHKGCPYGGVHLPPVLSVEQGLAFWQFNLPYQPLRHPL